MKLFDRIELVKAALFSVNPVNVIRQKARELFTPIWSQPPKRNSAQWLDLVMKSPRMDAIHKISSDVANTEYKLLVKNTKPKKEITDHVALKLLDEPCYDKTITKFNLFYLTELYKLSPAGEAFWIIERNGFGVPAELYIVPPHWVQSIPTKTIPYFKVLPMGNTSYQIIYVAPEDMIWFKSVDPINPYGRGRGRAEAIGDEIETDEQMAKWQKAKFFNGAIPSYIGVMPGAGAEEVDIAEAKFNQKYGGSNSGHKTGFLNWDAKITKLSDNEQEMDYIASRKFLRDTCLQHYNMSGELFGILENANRSTIDLAYELYAKNTLSIELKAFDDTLNRQFLPQFDEKLYISHDNVIPTDRDFELKKSESGLKNGGITVDEWRLSNGYEEFPGRKGKVRYVPLNMTTINMTESVDMSSYEDEDIDDGDKMVKGIKKKEGILVAYDKAAKKYEKALKRKLIQYFKQQQQKILSNFQKSLLSITAKDNSEDDFEDESNVDQLIDWTIEIALLNKLLKPYWVALAKNGYDIASELYTLDSNTQNIVNDKMSEWVKIYGNKNVNNITNTTKNSLREALGVLPGESNEVLQEKIKAIYADILINRTQVIAENETMASISNANYEAIKAAGFSKHQWITAKDEAVRLTHSEIDGQVVNIGEKFSNGLKYPHDPEGAASETIRCRCITIAI